MPEKNVNDWTGLTDDDLINQLIPDPNNPDLNVILGAFLGKGTNEKMVRLYTTIRLNQYFEIPRDKILGARRFPSDRIAVWIPGDLKVQLITTATLSGDFLKGNIQSAFAARGNTGSTLNSMLAAMAGDNGSGVTDFFQGCVSNSGTPDPFCTPPQPPTGCGCRRL